MGIEVKNCPELRMGGMRYVGPYGSPGMIENWGKMHKWMAEHNLAKGVQMIGLYWDDPAQVPADQCRMDAGFILPEGFSEDSHTDIQYQSVPSGTYAVLSEDVAMNSEGFQAAWGKLYQWIHQQGHQTVQAVNYELYPELDCDSSENKTTMRVDIHAPVVPAG
ncbi:MAG: GyrI-like domain-containing protein [Magnetococcales bacterium]|nr:GyrI-like domain-containing protein [Magnetococcales bacterium]